MNLIGLDTKSGSDEVLDDELDKINKTNKIESDNRIKKERRFEIDRIELKIYLNTEI